MDIAVVDEEKNPGSRIEAYSTGEELLVSGKRFDIVFLDIQMDGMNGIEAARELRERQEDTVLIFITGVKEYVFDALDQSDILHIESRAKKLEIHTTGADKAIEIYVSMDELEGQLGEDFYRCHRAYIVNMAQITEYDNESITLTNGDKVYLTKKKYGEFVKAYMWFLQNGGCVQCIKWRMCYMRR